MNPYQYTISLLVVIKHNRIILEPAADRLRLKRQNDSRDTNEPSSDFSSPSSTPAIVLQFSPFSWGFLPIQSGSFSARTCCRSPSTPRHSRPLPQGSTARLRSHHGHRPLSSPPAPLPLHSSTPPNITDKPTVSNTTRTLFKTSPPTHNHPHRAVNRKWNLPNTPPQCHPPTLPAWRSPTSANASH